MTYEGNHVANTPKSTLAGDASAYWVNRSMVKALWMRDNTEERPEL